MNALAPLRTGGLIHSAGTCPCCGGPVDLDAITMDLSGNTISHRGRTAVLSRSEAEIAAALVAAYPGTVRHHEMTTAVWGGYDAPLTALDINKVRICHLRKKIAPIGLTVRGVNRVGYRLIRVEEEI